MINDGKKSFFELNQMSVAGGQAEQKPLHATVSTEEGKNDTQNTEIVPIEKNTAEKQLPIADETEMDDMTGKNENDLNALDYEADKDDNMDEPETAVAVQRVEIQQQQPKANEKSSRLDKHGGGDEKSAKKHDDTKKAERRRRSRSRDKRSRDRRHSSRGRNDRRVRGRRDHSPHSRDNRRRDARRNRSPSYERRRRNRDSR